jgi:hypothetical protein
MFVAAYFIQINKKTKNNQPIFIVLGVLLYIAQIFESCFSQTFKLVWQSPSWEDFNVFKIWFIELKKCRPLIKFTYSPNSEQQLTIKTQMLVE